METSACERRGAARCLSHRPPERETAPQWGERLCPNPGRRCEGGRGAPRCHPPVEGLKEGGTAPRVEVARRKKKKEKRKKNPKKNRKGKEKREGPAASLTRSRTHTHTHTLLSPPAPVSFPLLSAVPPAPLPPPLLVPAGLRPPLCPPGPRSGTKPAPTPPRRQPAAPEPRRTPRGSVAPRPPLTQKAGTARRAEAGAWRGGVGGPAASVSRQPCWGAAAPTHPQARGATPAAPPALLRGAAGQPARAAGGGGAALTSAASLSLADIQHAQPGAALPAPTGPPSCFLLLLDESGRAPASICTRRPDVGARPALRAAPRRTPAPRPRAARAPPAPARQAPPPWSRSALFFETPFAAFFFFHFLFFSFSFFPLPPFFLLFPSSP